MPDWTLFIQDSAIQLMDSVSWKKEKIPYLLMLVLSALATCRIHFYHTIGFELCCRVAVLIRTLPPPKTHTHTHTHTHTPLMCFQFQRSIKEMLHIQFSSHIF
jgi:hypothetical protein